MALPGAAFALAKTVGSFANGRYRNAAGRFISKATFNRINAAANRLRGPGGAFVTKSQFSYARGFDAYMRAEVGAPSAGKVWSQLASKYPDRFEDYVNEYEGKFR